MSVRDYTGDDSFVRAAELEARVMWCRSGGEIAGGSVTELSGFLVLSIIVNYTKSTRETSSIMVISKHRNEKAMLART